METQIIYGTANTIYFPVIVAGGTDFAVAADWTPAATDIDISIDGGTFTQATNTAAFVSGSPIVSLALTAAESSGSRISIVVVDSATKAIEDQFIAATSQLSGQIEANQGIIIGEVDTATFTASTTQLEALAIWPSATEETTADWTIGRNILFTSGALTGVMVPITDYVLANSKMKFTYTAISTGESPADAVRFVIL